MEARDLERYRNKLLEMRGRTRTEINRMIDVVLDDAQPLGEHDRAKSESIDKEIIFEAIESALATATRKRATGDIEARVEINRATGEYKTFRRWQVIDESLAEKAGEDDDVLVFDAPGRQYTLEAAKELDPELEHGSWIEEPMDEHSMSSYVWLCDNLSLPICGPETAEGKMYVRA